MSSGGSKDSVIGYWYSMDIHMGWCRGPVNELVEIKAGDRVAWTGSVTENTTITINARDLFGGEKKEGGIQGTLKVMMGERDQGAELTSLMPGPWPAWRGRVTAFFSGRICANSPYPKEWEVRLRRWDKGWTDVDDTPAPWYPEKSLIDLGGGRIKAMNGVHVLYEIITNRDWGRGISRDLMDDEKWRAAANTAFDEQLGVCFFWSREDQDIDDFIETVRNHISCAMYQSKESGLITVKLIRKDYDADTLPVYGYGSGLLRLEDDTSKAAEFSVNEVIANYFDPELGEQRQVRSQSLGLQQASGQIKSKEVSYLGFPTAGLASRAAQRDLRAESSGLRSTTAIFDRRAWRLAPGDVIKINVPNRNLNNTIVRVMEVEEETFEDGSVHALVAQDAFTLPATSFISAQPDGWVPPDLNPSGSDTLLVMEMTYRSLFIRTILGLLPTIPVDSDYLGALAVRPDGFSTSYDILTKLSTETDYQQRGAGYWVESSLTAESIGLDDTVVTLETPYVYDGENNIVGSSALIDDEIVRIDGISGDGLTLTIARGCVDTIPETHSINARVWFYDLPNVGGMDSREYVAGDDVSVAFATRTPSGVLSVLDSPKVDHAVQSRQGLPYPPGKLAIQGVPYANALTDYDDDVVFTWAHRDRITQQDILIDQTADSIGPETDVTYTVEIVVSSAVVRTVSAIAGVTWTYTTAMMTTDGVIATTEYTFRLQSWRGVYGSKSVYSVDLRRVP